MNAKDNNGQTALYYVAREGNLEILKWLTEEKNADVNANDYNGQTALHKAAWGGNLEVIR